MDDFCNSRICAHCKQLKVEQAGHPHLTKLARFVSETTYKCDGCGSVWVYEPTIGWSMLRAGDVASEAVNGC